MLGFGPQSRGIEALQGIEAHNLGGIQAHNLDGIEAHNLVLRFLDAALVVLFRAPSSVLV